MRAPNGASPRARAKRSEGQVTPRLRRAVHVARVARRGRLFRVLREIGVVGSRPATREGARNFRLALEEGRLTRDERQPERFRLLIVDWSAVAELVLRRVCNRTEPSLAAEASASNNRWRNGEVMSPTKPNRWRASSRGKASRFGL